jgi:hypothetical protein
MPNQQLSNQATFQVIKVICKVHMLRGSCFEHGQNILWDS